MAIYRRTVPTGTHRGLGVLALLAIPIAGAATYGAVLFIGLGAGMSGHDLHEVVLLAWLYALLPSLAMVAAVTGAVAAFTGLNEEIDPTRVSPAWRERLRRDSRWLQVGPGPGHRFLGWLSAACAVVPGFFGFLMLPSLDSAVSPVLGLEILSLLALGIVLMTAAYRLRRAEVIISRRGLRTGSSEQPPLPLPTGREDLSCHQRPHPLGLVRLEARLATPRGPRALTRLSRTTVPLLAERTRASMTARLDELWAACRIMDGAAPATDTGTTADAATDTATDAATDTGAKPADPAPGTAEKPTDCA